MECASREDNQISLHYSWLKIKRVTKIEARLCRKRATKRLASNLAMQMRPLKLATSTCIEHFWVDITVHRHENVQACPNRELQSFIQKSYKLKSGSKSMYSLLDKLVFYSFSIFLNKVLDFFNCFNVLVLVSHKSVSYEQCIATSMERFHYK